MKVTNPNPYAVTLAHLTFGTLVSGDSADGPSSNFVLDTNATTSVTIPVFGKATSGATQAFNVVDLLHSAPDGCQGVTVPVGATGSQA
jgi:hypothetical protein